MREDVVIEVVMRIVHHAAAFAAFAITDVDVTAWLRLKHEGEVLRAHIHWSVANNVAVAEHACSHLAAKFDVLGVIDERRISTLVVDADGRAEGMTDVLGDAPNARFHLVLDFRL